MTNDNLYALVLTGIFAAVIARGWFCYTMLEVLYSLTRPGATVLLLVGLVVVYLNGLLYTSLIYGVLVIYLLRDIWTYWPNADSRRLFIETNQDQSRFKDSVDLQWARKTVTHDSPNMLHKDSANTPLLLYPPSQATLQSMSG